MSDTPDFESEDSSLSQLTPGMMLRQAREALKLSHIDVARQLKLRVQWVVDIENDHYLEASALIYVRGYLKSYAKLVNVDSGQVLNALHHVEVITQADAPTNQSPQFITKQRRLLMKKTAGKVRSKRSGRLWVVFGVMVLCASYWVYHHPIEASHHRYAAIQIHSGQ